MHIKVLMKTVPVSRILFSDYILDFPKIDPMVPDLDFLEPSHLVKRRENASAHAEGNHDEKYREFHSHII